MDTVKDFISAHIPELKGCDILIAKLCWDSFALDLDFVIDWVPDVEDLVVVAGGSGHGKFIPDFPKEGDFSLFIRQDNNQMSLGYLGFKFLPTLGKHVVDVLENRPTKFTEMWKWRKPSEEALTTFKDFIVESNRRLDEQQMASTSDLSW